MLEGAPMNEQSRGNGWREGLAVLTWILSAVLLAGCDGRSVPVAEVGDIFPAVRVQDLGHGFLNSEEWRGQAVVLNLWATWCAPCREEMPSLERLSRILNKQDFLVVGIALDQDPNLVREFILQFGISFPIAIDPNGRTLTKVLGAKFLPETWLIGPEGRIVDRVAGSAAWDSPPMRERVLAAMAHEGGQVVKSILVSENHRGPTLELEGRHGKDVLDGAPRISELGD